jgi:hypothetical protein
VLGRNRVVAECNNLALQFDAAGINLDDEVLDNLLRGIILSRGDDRLRENNKVYESCRK